MSVGEAVCNTEVDQFSKKIGREIATGRAKKKFDNDFYLFSIKTFKDIKFIYDFVTKYLEKDVRAFK